MRLGDTMSEGTDTSVPASETAEPESVSPPPGKGSKLWLKIVAIVVAIALVATVLIVALPNMGGGKKLTATIKGADPLEVDAGTTNSFTVVVKSGKTDISNETTTKIKWSVDPAGLGEFSLKAKPTVPFVAGIVGGNGTVSVEITVNGEVIKPTRAIHVLAPFLDAVSVTPSSKTIAPGGNYTFRAAAVSSVGLSIDGLEFTWSATAGPGVTYTLNSTTGSVVNLEVGTTLGNLTLSATASYSGISMTGSSNVTVGYPPPRSMDFKWYDLFNVPVQSWYDKRFPIYHQEERITSSYPWVFLYHSEPDGNEYVYSLMRLNITGRNVSEVNTNERPEFLPVLSPTERGGTIDIDWYMQYMTTAQLLERYGTGIANQDEGWIIDLNGTVVLDKQAAKMVLNMTDTGWDTFSSWWTSHKVDFNGAYSDWLVNEAEGRVDIENAYESYYQLFTIDINAQKVGDKIVLTYDILTWGMEALMLRWLYESFLPIEMWYEDMNFHMKIMPEYSTVDIDTAVTYAAFASVSMNTTLSPDDPGWANSLRAYPTWTFQPLMGDAVVSSTTHPHSDFDAYSSKNYTNLQAGGKLYGQQMAYDVVPSSWNLSENETLSFTWPAGTQSFIYTVRPGIAINVTDEIYVDYSEPNQTDFPSQVVVDNQNRLLEFKGPIDMWDWSKYQTSHKFLNSSWENVSLLPYGMPSVEFKKKTPVHLYLDHFDVTATSPIPANDFVTVNVTAKDQFNNIYYDYNGTVNFTCGDPAAVLPDNYTFTMNDSGNHVFIGGVQFQATGSQTLTVTNVSTDTPLKIGTKVFSVGPKREAATFDVGVYHVPTVGVADDVSIEVYDQYGDFFINYTGTVTFSTNKTADVVLPSDYTFTLADAGEHTIVGALTFLAAGWFNITANDTVTSATGSQTNIMAVTVPEAIDHFTVSGIKSMLLKQKSDVTVVAYEQYGMVFERYTGTIHFSANASGANLPADYTFTFLDEGRKVIKNGVSFDVTQDTVFSVSVVDTVTTAATGQQDNILIQYKPAKEVFRMYDLFEQPWGEFYTWRWAGYKTDIVLNNESGKYTMIYNADMRGQQGVIYAPYRWNMTGENMSAINMAYPQFMPVFGNPNIAGSSAKLDVYFQYYDHAWWNSYWKPYWNMDDLNMDSQTLDGYYLGVVYNVDMNRKAAESWLGMPQSANPATWWNANGPAYIDYWNQWIMSEGNSRLDIYSGYEYPYAFLDTKMKMTVLGNGDIHLEIGHLSWGYEVLLTRWFTDAGLCNHEPYFEDATLSVQYYPQWSDFTFDAVCQYSLHAVKANESTTNEGAWAWEPQLIDYMDSAVSGHPSTFDPWAPLTYQSWNAGDPFYGQEVGYDSGYQYFNLTDYQTFIIQLPLGNDVLGYYAQPVLSGRTSAITKIILGTPSSIGHTYNKYAEGDGTNWNYEEYWPLMYNGTMSLGWVGNSSSNPDLRSMYNPTTNTITMVGPMSFDNTHHASGALYRGAPFIEFNVTLVVGGTSVPAPSSGAAENPASLTTEMVSLATVVAATTIVIVALVMGVRRRPA
jgi:hypothetical protein